MLLTEHNPVRINLKEPFWKSLGFLWCLFEG